MALLQFMVSSPETFDMYLIHFVKKKKKKKKHFECDARSLNGSQLAKMKKKIGSLHVPAIEFIG